MPAWSVARITYVYAFIYLSPASGFFWDALLSVAFAAYLIHRFTEL